jgi:hypothetical protein
MDGLGSAGVVLFDNPISMDRIEDHLYISEAQGRIR